MIYNKLKIFLSASVPDGKNPDKYIKIPNAQIQIEEAVISLARAVFEKRGQLVFGGHPSITPLVAMVATEFGLLQDAEDVRKDDSVSKPVVIYQSKIFEGKTVKELDMLVKQGYTRVNWIDAAGGEIYKEGLRGKDYPKSMEALRLAMIEQHFDAMICVGGMEGVEDEFEYFTKIHPKTRVYLLTSTGGATKNLEKRAKGGNIKLFDAGEYQKYSDEFIAQLNTGENKERGGIEFNYQPYSLITAMIVRDILNGEQ